MATLHNLTVVVEQTGKKIPVKQVDDQMTAEELLVALTDKISLPAGTRGMLTRKQTHKQVLPKQTLQAAGVTDEDVLIADFEKTAGGKR